jgi:hypothetical protein
MKKTFLVFGIIVFTFLLSCVIAAQFSVEYGDYGSGGVYDKENPQSAWIWIDTDGDYNPNYTFWFPNPEPFAQNNPDWLDFIKEAKQNHDDIDIEFASQEYNGEVRYYIINIRII